MRSRHLRLFPKSCWSQPFMTRFKRPLFFCCGGHQTTSPHSFDTTTHRLSHILYPRSTINNMSSTAYPVLNHSSSKIVSPIDRLPTELLQAIFKECTLPDPSKIFDKLTTAMSLPEPGINKAPLVLTRVSSRWRSVATSSPEPWSSIRVDDLSLPYECQPWRLALFCVMLEKWLRNSKNMPLNVILYDVSPHTNPIWEEIIPVFRNHAHHCAMFVAPSHMMVKMFDRHVDMPMLQRFGAPSFKYDFAVNGLSPASPVLTELYSHHVVNYSSLPQDVARKLRLLNVFRCNEMLDILNMLRHFPELRRFSLTFCMNEGPIEEEMAITHQHLEELKVPGSLFEPFVAPYVRFPKLRKLTTWGVWTPSKLQELVKWLKDSELYLERLHLVGGLEGEMTDEEVVEMFKPYARERKVSFEKPRQWGT